MPSTRDGKAWRSQFYYEDWQAGFQFEGLLRNNAIKNGKVLDMIMYSLIQELR